MLYRILLMSVSKLDVLYSHVLCTGIILTAVDPIDQVAIFHSSA